MNSNFPPEIFGSTTEILRKLRKASWVDCKLIYKYSMMIISIEQPQLSKLEYIKFEDIMIIISFESSSENSWVT